MPAFRDHDEHTQPLHAYRTEELRRSHECFYVLAWYALGRVAEASAARAAIARDLNARLQEPQ
jgi:hypothetical protein